VTKGVPLALLGLGFVWAFVGIQGTDCARGYWTGVALGAVGLLVFLVALGRSLLPPLFYSWGWIDLKPPYLVPNGLVLMFLGLVYVGVSVGIWSESRFVVLLRRELASYFYSPIAYIVFLGMTAVGWYRYVDFLNELLTGRPFLEPVVSRYVMSLFTVLAVIFIVPVLTMRLLSEEWRSGTLEVLFTAPVHELTVVLSKFFAAFFVFLAAWLPWWLFLVALRVEGGREMDYRPMLAFFIALAFTGASFISMGLFFSSLTRNQIASAILTFVTMMLLATIVFLKGQLDPNSGVTIFLSYFSFIDLWGRSLQGAVIPSYLFFYLSATMFWLFLTVKVLEARKWS
jgi:ABC-type transport system involved in multi-copper enzyme maturation permease subunit